MRSSRVKTYTVRACCGMALLLGLAGVPACGQTGTGTASAIPTNAGIFRTRGGLPNVFAKLKSGQPVAVAYLGGSITAGSGATQPNVNSYRALVGQWFTATYPQAVVTNVNAGYGGTGSDFGAFRLEHDVLSKHPDLVFVEFAVNDGANALAARGMEGIVRHIRRASPSTDVCFVYTTVAKSVDTYKNGAVPGAVALEEKIADYYNLPSVNVGLAGALRILNTGLTSAQFFRDGTHPTDVGHQTYADALISFLTDQSQHAPAAHRYSLPTPMRADTMETARMIAPEEVKPLAAGWSIADKRLPSQFQSVLTADTPGAVQDIPFSGPMLALYLSLGADTGSFDYKIDSGDWKTIDPFDFKRYGHSAYRTITDGLPAADHVLSVRINPNHNQYSSGTTTRIGYVCVDPTH